MPAKERARVDWARSVEGAGGPGGAASRVTDAHSAPATNATTSERTAKTAKRRRVIGSPRASRRDDTIIADVGRKRGGYAGVDPGLRRAQDPAWAAGRRV